jgi:hypothetical protein
LDLVRLKPLLEEVLQSWDLSASLAKTSPLQTPEYAPLRELWGELKKSYPKAVAAEQKWLREWRTRTAAWIGENTDKNQLIQEIKETIEAAKHAGLAREFPARELTQRLERLREERVMDALTETKKLAETESKGAVVSVLGQGLRPVALLCDELFRLFEEFERSALADIKSEERRLGDDPARDAQAATHEELDAIEKELKRLQVSGSTVTGVTA